MFAKIAVVIALGAAQIFIPFGKPKPVRADRPPIKTAGPAFDATCEDNDEWDKPAPRCGSTATSSRRDLRHIGHPHHRQRRRQIVIDSGHRNRADLVAANIRHLASADGLKYLLHSHETSIMSWLARLQQLTGAQLSPPPAAAAVFATGAPERWAIAGGMHPPFPAGYATALIQDGGTFRLGDLMLTRSPLRATRPGALTCLGSCDGGRLPQHCLCRQPVPSAAMTIASAIPAYLAAIAQPGETAALDCDILLTTAPVASGMLDRMAGRARSRTPMPARTMQRRSQAPGRTPGQGSRRQ